VFACQGDKLKHLFLNNAQVAFWVAQKSGNEFAGSFDPLKYRFLDFTQVAFWDAQKT
jgi:hypothetical protein